MSILGSITPDDLGGRGKPLPNAKYRGTIESATISPETNGTRLVLQVGQLATPDGATEIAGLNGDAPYRIGNRKVFVREWTDHQNDQAADIGRKRIKQLLVATGLVAKPEKGQSVEVPFQTFEEVAGAVTGCSFMFTSKQTRRKTKFTNEAGQEVYVDAFESDGETPKIDVEVAVFHAP